MTYNELRTAVAANITNQAALLSLLTSANVETVEKCAPGLGNITESYQSGNALNAYQSGKVVAENLYDSKQAPRTVDEVLSNFTPGNLYAAQLYARLNEAISAGQGTEAEFFEGLETVSNEIAPLPC